MYRIHIYTYTLYNTSLSMYMYIYIYVYIYIVYVLFMQIYRGMMLDPLGRPFRILRKLPLRLRGLES